jgi:hypothetical protein
MDGKFQPRWLLGFVRIVNNISTPLYNSRAYLRNLQKSFTFKNYSYAKYNTPVKEK